MDANKMLDEEAATLWQVNKSSNNGFEKDERERLTAAESECK